MIFTHFHLAQYLSYSQVWNMAALTTVDFFSSAVIYSGENIQKIPFYTARRVEGNTFVLWPRPHSSALTKLIKPGLIVRPDCAQHDKTQCAKHLH